MLNNLVTVITPSYNSSEFISSTILSVLSQTYINWEMIIIDDCSVDSSREIIEEFIKKDKRIKLIKLAENSGAAVARNRGIKESKGRYIAFLDSDDVWHSDKLKLQLEFMQKNNYPFTFTAYRKVDENNVYLGKMGVPNKVCYSDLLKMCSIGCLTSVYDTNYFGKIYMPLIRKRQDLGLWLKLLKKIDYAYGLNDVLADYRVRDGSISSNKLKVSSYTWRLYREVEGLGLIKSSYYFSNYAIRGLLRTKLPYIARLLRVLH